MAVAFDAKTATATESATPLTVSNLTVGTGDNRAMLVLVWWTTSIGVPSPISVIWDSGGTNQAMTLVTSTQVSNTNSSTACSIYGLIAPTSGNKNLVITWTGAGAPEGHAAAISFTGVDQTSTAIAFPHGATNLKSVSTSNPTSITIISAVGNMVVAGHQNQAAVFSATSDTTLAIDNVGPVLAVAFNYADGAASNTLTAAFAGSDLWGAVGCDVLAATGAIPVTVLYSLNSVW